MLFALLEEQDAAVEARLRQRKIAVAEVHAQLRRALGTGDDRMWEGILVTPRVRKLVSIAETLAAGEAVEPIHLFDAISTEAGGVTAGILSRAERNVSASTEVP